MAVSYLRDHPAIRPSLEHLVAQDKNFKKLFTPDDIDAIPHKHRAADFAAFARTIAGQQLSTKAAATIWARVEALTDRVTPASVLALDDAALRGAGLSGQKVAYLRGLAQAVADKRFVPARLKALPDDDVVAAITALKGFGRWSAEMVLMFALARPDVFSGGDLGLREGLRKVLKLPERPSEKEAVALAARWAGHRTAASLLLWHTQTMDF